MSQGDLSGVDPKEILADAIQCAVNADPDTDSEWSTNGSVVTKWVVIVEVMQPTGDKLFLSTAPADIKKWETLGMLNYALEIEKEDLGLSKDDEI